MAGVPAGYFANKAGSLQKFQRNGILIEGVPGVTNPEPARQQDQLRGRPPRRFCCAAMSLDQSGGRDQLQGA